MSELDTYLTEDKAPGFLDKLLSGIVSLVSPAEAEAAPKSKLIKQYWDLINSMAYRDVAPLAQRTALEDAKLFYGAAGDRLIEALPKKLSDFVAGIEPSHAFYHLWEPTSRVAKLQTLGSPSNLYSGLAHEIAGHAKQQLIMESPPNIYFQDVYRRDPETRARLESLAEFMAKDFVQRKGLPKARTVDEMLRDTLLRRIQHKLGIGLGRRLSALEAAGLSHIDPTVFIPYVKYLKQYEKMFGGGPQGRLSTDKDLYRYIQSIGRGEPWLKVKE